jgi:hypothetical protein
MPRPGQRVTHYHDGDDMHYHCEECGDTRAQPGLCHNEHCSNRGEEMVLCRKKQCEPDD